MLVGRDEGREGAGFHVKFYNQETLDFPLDIIIGKDVHCGKAED